MTQAEVDRLDTLRDAKWQLEHNFEATFREACDAIDDMLVKCDHLNPDGTSAVNREGKFHTICEICWQTDL